MKRRNFLLSIPIIGAAVKALITEYSEQKERGFNVKILKEKLDSIRKYPLTESECYDGTKIHPYVMDEVAMVGHPRPPDWVKRFKFIRTKSLFPQKRNSNSRG
jgi:hypothetical protein